MLDTSDERIRVECGPVAVSMLRARLLSCIKYILRNVVFNMRAVDLPPTCICQGDFLRGVRFLKSRLQA